MRIAHVTDCYAPRLGGIEQQVGALARHQSALGHDVHVFTSVPGDGEAATDDVTVHRPGGRGTGIRYFSAIRGSRAVPAGEFDVVHAHVSTVSPLGMISAARAARAGQPTAVTVHSLWTNLGPLYRPIERAFHLGNLPIAWSAVSGVAAESVRPFLGAGRPVAVLPNAVSVEDWPARFVPRPPDRVVVVTVGRLAARKRPRHLLRMLRDARAQIPADIAIEAVLVGDGPQRRLLEALVRRHRMDGWVRLPGSATHAEVRQLFAAADVYVAPATLESFGIAALEARCAGLPVVARRRSGISEFVTDGVDGFLAHDDEHMAALIARVAKDAELRAELRMHNVRNRPALGWEHALASCDTLYAEAARLAGREVARRVSA